MTPDANEAFTELDPLWTVAQVAKYLQVGRARIYQARRDEGLPAVVIGGVIRFRPMAVANWAASIESVEGAKVKSGRPKLEGSDYQGGVIDEIGQHAAPEVQLIK